MHYSLPSSRESSLLVLQGATPLSLELWPSGVLQAIRYDRLLLNQFRAGAAEAGLQRLLVRWEGEGKRGTHRLLGPAARFVWRGTCAEWHEHVAPGLTVLVTLAVGAEDSGWRWEVELHWEGQGVLSSEVIFGQDVGLADEAAVRGNEAYLSHYLDWHPVQDAERGWALLVRQNQATSQGRRPWLVVAAEPRAESFGTDAWQFFGTNHRLTDEPAVLRLGRLPAQRWQYEGAYAGLVTAEQQVETGGVLRFACTCLFRPDHPEATSAQDYGEIARACALRLLPSGAVQQEGRAGGLFIEAPSLVGDLPSEEDLHHWHGGVRHLAERDESGQLLSFFGAAGEHVVLRTKEERVLRPHGHVLRSGHSLSIDQDQFGVTAYAAGVFSAQAYVENPSFMRLTSVVRSALNVARGQGQRIFVRRSKRWHLLTVPSTFRLTPDQVVWHYRLGGQVLRFTLTCGATAPCACLAIEVEAGDPVELLISHQLVAGVNELDEGGEVEADTRWGAAQVRPSPESLMAKGRPGVSFVLAVDEPASLVAQGGESLLGVEEVAARAGWWCFRTRPVRSLRVLQLAVLGGQPWREALATAWDQPLGSQAPASPVKMQAADLRIQEIDTMLPWLAHNAWIHLSAPHGLEQYGGAAWGVRDVTQGSMEWLLASGRLASARRVLEVVFAQQYPDGTWPQWFMHAPFQNIQHAHSHGDVCFWPLKALADYVEASGDFAILEERLRFFDPQTFTPTGNAECLWTHVERVLEQVRSRFLPGTMLVNYGDGDWDDTLQPADPALRTSMVSAWTVALSYHVLRQWVVLAERTRETNRARAWQGWLEEIGRDFRRHLMPGGTVAGFLVRGTPQDRVLLHPDDRVTGINYRLLPMTRSILAELFTPEEARQHLALIRQHLVFVDGARLMDRPARYQGGVEVLFKRADTAANVGREIGLQYVHAHLRYVEALAKVGAAEEAWDELLKVIPVGLTRRLPQAELRQANVYFSSSDAAFADRVEAADGWERLREGKVTVRGGWRLYSSGPGIILRLVRQCLLGVRESWGELILDPVLPRSWDGLAAEVSLRGEAWSLLFHVRQAGAVQRVLLNGHALEPVGREVQPYRPGGWRLAWAELEKYRRPSDNQLEIFL